MKITRSQLRKLIEESLALTEAEYSEGDTLYYDEDSDGTPDDNYEYKSEKGVWYTRRRGSSGRWISLAASKYKSSTDKLDALYPDLSSKRSSTADSASSTPDSEKAIKKTAEIEKGIPDFGRDTRGTGLTDVDGLKEYRGEKGNVLMVFNTKGGDGMPKVVYFYPGIGSASYGEQPHVINMIKELPEPRNTVVIVARKYDTPWSELKSIQDKFNYRGGPPARLGGWSRGAQGVAQAMEAGRFSKIIYADPSPGFLLGKNHGPSTKMYYRTSNWAAKYRDRLDALAAEMGSKAEPVNKNHPGIAKHALVKLMFEK